MVGLMVALGGGVGATLRYITQVGIQKGNLPTYYATIIVNLLGSLLLGIAANWSIENQTDLSFLTIGVLGGFTTFSTFSFDVVKLIDQKQYVTMMIYIVTNLLGGLLFFWLGWNF
ncbi:fluoride efflux transporter CrcB [Lysinibacillus antri]|uniref:Fluoride-specific ion channel FluC n=1 Tax=Lysinibacillus antri TaxID=2498145 RepID=A0A432LGA6_9BACI|nr:fluoride efflux transporter CrcB [Lysinibacillus antri]RUL56897.1 fluoride efflux transporter CrcB [Lysinibacillus antri]